MAFGNPLPHIQRSHILYYEARQVVYLNNAKAACSTLKSALIRAIRADNGENITDLTPSQIHGGHDFWSPRVHLIDPAQTKCFSVVRNPFTRILSAYLDKICRKNLLRHQFLFQNDLPIDADISFAQFLQILAKNPDFAITDQHFRPQVENLFIHSLAPTRIHYLENFHDTAGDLTTWLDWDLDIQDRRPHSTGANDRLDEYFDAASIDIVRHLYADDFRVLGYGTDLGDRKIAPARHLDLDDVDLVARNAVDLYAMADTNVDPARLAQSIGSAPFDLRKRLFLAQYAPWVNRKMAKRPARPFWQRWRPDPWARLGRDRDFPTRIAQEAMAQYSQLQSVDRVLTDAMLLRLGSSHPLPSERLPLLARLVAKMPYIIGYRVQLIDLLIQNGDYDRAETLITQFPLITQRKQIARDLKARLIAAQAGHERRARISF